MTKEFIPYEQALELKEIGFDEPCYGYLTDDHFELNSELLRGSEMDETWLNIPTFSQAFRWFRETHNLDSYLKPEIIRNKKGYDFYIWVNDSEDLETGTSSLSTYEVAELTCLKELIKIVKNK